MAVEERGVTAHRVLQLIGSAGIDRTQRRQQCEAEARTEQSAVVP
jgi:hypothetical protein